MNIAILKYLGSQQQHKVLLFCDLATKCGLRRCSICVSLVIHFHATVTSHQEILTSWSAIWLWKEQSWMHMKQNLVIGSRKIRKISRRKGTTHKDLTLAKEKAQIVPHSGGSVRIRIART